MARTLAGQGADVTVADVVEHRRAEAERLGLRWTDPDKAITQAADIVVPAAVGGVLDAETVTRLETPLVVGPANNQLVSDDVAEALAEKGVVWVPDYVASAGGAIYAIAREVEGADHETALARVEAIEDVVARLLADSAANGTTPLAEAAALAERRLRASRS